MNSNTLVKIASFQFKKSGNACEVFAHLDPTQSCPVVSVEVSWNFIPTSALDRRLWTRKFYPMVCRRILALLPEGVKRTLAVDASGNVLVLDRDGDREPQGDL